MAQKAVTRNGEAAEGSARKAPTGFRRRSAVSEAPWFTNKEDNVAHGKLLGRYMMQVDPPRPYFQVELFSAATVTIGRGDDAEEKEAEAGTVINVGESYKLQCLKDVEIPEILAGGEYDVWVQVGKKIKVGNGRTMWLVDVQSKRTKAPTGEVRPLPADAAGTAAEGESEGAPF